jgi:hypothetical protein
MGKHWGVPNDFQVNPENGMLQMHVKLYKECSILYYSRNSRSIDWILSVIVLVVPKKKYLIGIEQEFIWNMKSSESIGCAILVTDFQFESFFGDIFPMCDLVVWLSYMSGNSARQQRRSPDLGPELDRIARQAQPDLTKYWLMWINLQRQ